MKVELSVPKRRHINFRRQGMAQKKEHNVCIVILIEIFKT